MTTALGIGLLLALTNPSRKLDYLAALSRRAHHRWCQRSEDEFCEMVGPMTRSLLPVLLLPATETQNYLFFSWFHTRLPCFDIVGIGIAGHYWIQPIPEEAPACSPSPVQLPNWLTPPIRNTPCAPHPPLRPPTETPALLSLRR